MADSTPDPQHDRPPYQPWYEGDFWTLRVRTMHSCARLMYRSLLQHAWDLNPPGQIPNDLKTIMTMADCWHPKIWDKYGAEVLKMFDLSSDGKFYTNARQLSELAQAAAKRASYRERGIHGAETKKNRKTKKTKDVKKAELKPSSNAAGKDGSNQPNPTQPNIEKLMATSQEVAQCLARYSEEEQCAVAEVWPFYLEKCDRDPHRYTLTAPRISKAVMRFKECRNRTGTFEGAIAMMKEAISNLAATPFNMGANEDKRKYVDFIDHLFGTTGTMEKRLNDVPTTKPAPRSAAPVNNNDADKVLAENLGI